MMKIGALGMIAAVVLPWLTVSEQPAAQPQLSLLIFNSAAAPSLVMDVAREEVETVLGDIGVAVEWNDSSTGTVVPENRFHVKVMIMSKDPSRWNLPHNAMGVTFIVGEVPDTIYVFMPVVNEAVGDRRFPQKIGQALGRVIVHELVHVMDPTRDHADDGLMAAHQRGRDLYGSCLALDQASAAAFTAGLERAQVLTAGSLPSAPQ